MYILNNKPKAILGIVLLLSTLFLACKENPSPQEVQEPYQLESNLFMTGDGFDQALNYRQGVDEFDILDIRREGTYLHLEVKGGAEAGAFRFLWDGWIQESYPMGIRLVLQHAQGRADFDPNAVLQLKVNLRKIIGKRHVENYHFYVRNGSKDQPRTLNPDGTVSDR